ncbi:hypothetical protein [Sphingomonas sp.]|jgi:predicted ArsR family transcriptional regulator|uniref:hypothetical protein n=1 Tax=Sphingomonas sp. TaxID=28214 RepID=UPI0035C7CD1B
MTAPAPTAIDRPLAEALAEELVIASRLLGELGYELGCDPETLRRHMTSLQKIDLITQMQLAVADVLRHAATSADVVSLVTLEETAARLRA